jgi:N-acyl-D-amino-acid deacylase
VGTWPSNVSDRIARVGGVIPGESKAEIRAQGAVVSPGFIDVHTHDDRLVLVDPTVLPKLSQGVTTVVTGNCGISLAPMQHVGSPPAPLTLLGGSEHFRHTTFKAYLDEVRRSGVALNIVPFIGHTSLRVSAMANLDEVATRAELDRMTGLLDEAMKSGAFGLSTGLYYPPASAAAPDEIVSLLHRVSDYGGLTTMHIRDEGDNLMPSIEEALSFARTSGVPLVISHLKCAAPNVWGRSAKVLNLLDKAAQHQEIAFDVYPYDASSTMLRPDRLGAARRIVVSWSEPYPNKAGQDLANVASCWCCAPEEAARRLSPGGGIYFTMQEDDVRRIVAHRRSMIGSDGLPHDAHPHPRLCGTFPRVLGRYVRELKLLTLPQAVRKMTSLPAAVFGLEDRGVLKEGAMADLTIFDDSLVIDEATYDRPLRPSIGVRSVIVNGGLVWSNGVPTGAMTGRVLQHQASERT